MAYWGVDLVKCDHCHKPGGVDDFTLYSNFSRHLNATGHPMCVSTRTAAHVGNRAPLTDPLLSGSAARTGMCFAAQDLCPLLLGRRQRN